LASPSAPPVLGIINGKALKDSVPSIGGGGFLGTVCVALIIFVSLIPFFAFKHLSRAIGAGKVRSLIPITGVNQVLN
jgi:hypothetical protein